MCDCSKNQAINWCEGSTNVPTKINKESSKPFFVDKTAPTLFVAYTDARTRARKDFSVHAIQDFPYQNCFALGTYARGGTHSPPPAGVARRYCTSDNNAHKVFATPKSFTKGWDSKGAGSRCRCCARPPDGSFWIPNCPAGFVELSSVALHISNSATVNYNNFKGVRCLNKKYAVEAAWDKLIWNSDGARANKKAETWSIKDSPFWHTKESFSGKWRKPIYRINPAKLG